jgi:chromosome segregation ATPase
MSNVTLTDKQSLAVALLLNSLTCDHLKGDEWMEIYKTLMDLKKPNWSGRGTIQSMAAHWRSELGTDSGRCMNDMARVVSILEKNQEILLDFQYRIESLERELETAQETIRDLETNHEVLANDVRGLESEVRDLTTDVESLQQEEYA